MIAKVILYKNTGLTPGNVLDSATLLDTLGFNTLEYSDIAILQDRGIFSLNIAEEYEKIYDVDYCRIEVNFPSETPEVVRLNYSCYWVTGLNMLNENVAQLQLAFDAITTVGIENIDVIAGWCVRRSVNDPYIPFKYTIQEDFVPNEPLELEYGSEIKVPDNKIHPSVNKYKGSGIPIIVSTVALSIPKNESTFYKAVGSENSDVGVYAPSFSQLGEDETTIYESDIGLPENTFTHSVKVYGTAAFLGDDQWVIKGATQAYSLGAEQVIIASYLIPAEYANIVTFPLKEADASLGTQGRYIAILGNQKRTASSTLTPLYDTGEYQVHNAKTWSGQFNKVTLLSLTSGQQVEYDIEYLVNPETSTSVFQYYLEADLRYNGYPMCYPTYYKGMENSRLFLGSVKGAQWERSPIKFMGESGAQLDLGRKVTSVTNNIAYSRRNMMLDVAQGALSFGLRAGTYAGLSYGAEVNRPQYRQNPWDFDANWSWGDVNRGVGGIGLDSLNTMNRGVGNALKNLEQSALNIEMLGHEYNSQYTIPNIIFAQTPTMQNYIGNNFYDYRIRLSQNDTIRFDKYLTEFGYRVNEPFTNDCLVGRRYFNYIQATGVNIKVPFNLTDKKQIISTFQAGVRIWHVAPNQDALSLNPTIREQSEGGEESVANDNVSVSSVHMG